jgi:hypothetical protein
MASVTSGSATDSLEVVTIREFADKCLHQFQVLAKLENELRSQTIKAVEDATENWRSQEQLQRFRLWSGNIGVFAEGHASLDYRVRNSENARQLMIDFLRTLLLALSTGPSY